MCLSKRRQSVGVYRWEILERSHLQRVASQNKCVQRVGAVLVAINSLHNDVTLALCTLLWALAAGAVRLRVACFGGPWRRRRWDAILQVQGALLLVITIIIGGRAPSAAAERPGAPHAAKAARCRVEGAGGCKVD